MANTINKMELVIPGDENSRITLDKTLVLSPNHKVTIYLKFEPATVTIDSVTLIISLDKPNFTLQLPPPAPGISYQFINPSLISVTLPNVNYSKQVDLHLTFSEVKDFNMEVKLGVPVVPCNVETILFR